MSDAADTARFNAKWTGEPNSGCWLWLASVNSGGYGQFGWGASRHIPAHRASWLLHRGPIPEGMDVLHRCDIPSCVNPDHLRIGTHTENMADKVQRGRCALTTRKRAKITPAQADAIIADRRPQKEIAVHYGVSRAMVCGIKSGRYLKHILRLAP